MKSIWTKENHLAVVERWENKRFPDDEVSFVLSTFAQPPGSKLNGQVSYNRAVSLDDMQLCLTIAALLVKVEYTFKRVVLAELEDGSTTFYTYDD